MTCSLLTTAITGMRSDLVDGNIKALLFSLVHLCPSNGGYVGVKAVLLRSYTPTERSISSLTTRNNEQNTIRVLTSVQQRPNNVGIFAETR
ncbi:hypothetical protein Pdw03_8483 [Penicillium digitatum]|uniref:Uncharacterized protein n=1 Tax=Penicillium digitatum TaxID=36651 RepID=A0A7T6XP92_PENDI|nr:hypothetical protein Pdw03_8483 [Penicillium digitatum]